MHPTAVVVGLHQNGLGVARALGRRGVPVIAVDQAQNDAYGATRYARRVSSDDLKGMGLIETLQDIGESFDERAMLILTLDRSVLLVSEHRARLERYFVHSLPPDPVVRRLMNKTETERFARSQGFDMARTFSIRSEDDLDECISEIRLPCVLKPEVKTVAFVEHSPKKAFFIESVDALRDAWQQVVQWEPVVVVQEWIPGPETSLVFGLFYFDESCVPLAFFGGRKIRQYIPHCGTACSAEPWDDEIVHREGVRFFTTAGYRGFGAIEFKIGPDGKYYLIEPTVGRTEHIFALAAANGVNLPYVGYRHMAGLPVPTVIPHRRSAIYVDWKRDVRAARELISAGTLTWPGWVRSIARRQQHALWAWDDPAPFARNISSRLSRKTHRVFMRIQRRMQQRLKVWRGSVGVQLETLGAAVQPRAVPGELQAHIETTLEWLCAAQDAADGGVARGYSISAESGYPVGWQPAYPETTGYIIPTFFDAAEQLGNRNLADRAVRMADWLLTVQLDNGAFPGGTIERYSVPVVFNTGMVLLGLTRAYAETKDANYRDAMSRAGEFLVSVQSKDGAWRRFVNLNGEPGLHAYDCLVTWGLIQASRLLGEPRLAESAIRNLEWTLTLQRENGWFAYNALRPNRNKTPLTHTVAYAAQGFLEAGLLLDAPRFVAAAERTAAALVDCLGPDGFLAGEFDSNWQATASWSCLTGTAQMAVIWWRLFERTGEPRYGEAARRAGSYLRCRQELALGDAGTRGGVAGSFPIEGRYGRYQFLNWAAKFLVDALLLEQEPNRSSRAEVLRRAAPRPTEMTT